MIGGVAAAAVSLGVAQLVSIPFPPQAEPRNAVGSAIVDLTPGPVKEWVIQALGGLDKLFLALVVLAVIATTAAIAATYETRRRPAGSAIFTVAGLLGCAAVLSRPGATALDIVPTLVGTACGVAALRLLALRLWTTPDDDHDELDTTRRVWLITAALLGFGAASGLLGVVVNRLTSSVAAERNTSVVPSPRVPAPPVPAGVQPRDVALPSFITDAADFYRVDVALSVPQLSRDDWRLRIHGMVDREITYSFADLARFEAVEKPVTLTCVSNPVGGDLISNGMWIGYRLTDLLRAAGVAPDADMLLSTSVDGFTVGTPVEVLSDGRDALLAVGLNGQPLPVEHGYPARLVVAGLYGYVSATKWVTDLELTRFDRAEAYWTRQGWAPRGPIKTESRIDVPKSGQKVPAGSATFGGVAWAQNRGVRDVEVRIDDGPWQPAQLGTAYSNQTWRLWSFPWQATSPGSHSITVRATDNTGTVQTSDETATVPDGATGWHSVNFTVAQP
ncbi:molybdopterin-dependent oxidoreductase [Mycobacterium sp. CBMA247]|nr:molybdopterin-dependent oxidoreductase [Mycolicibacterium sp. CBMA 329]MUL88737.1 molybdopterin-dependent oxidoreductase [Mycolicibacterium sp. CBMA 331]MUM01969.1 molybdopterin-dependent oxidoreductase [Mycolicibacterium sp. CBMA 334]MUM29238.1 molybdopterin-dependent oxidoreductase [Mycolicibacterium sp. CBMA 295]MUM40384.1 molybdopterin-dependent oxidoreductase [Mycolicibacterium sp. CBMA 247]MUM44801.1 molybdopterin-dependent oxidoreductase [Mycolicibacterium sp. CBMA 294]